MFCLQCYEQSVQSLSYQLRKKCGNETKIRCVFQLFNKFQHFAKWPLFEIDVLYQ